jgi:hypothetical protein
MKKEQPKKEIVSAVVKEKKPKVELVTYTVKAIIPCGMYANIQPEVTVKAKTLEEAERAVMPHIEKLFAKYRDGNGTPPPEKPVVGTILATSENKPTFVPDTTNGVVVPTAPEQPKVVLAAPFERAKQRIEGCVTIEALNLVTQQVKKSEKLTEQEKTNAYSLIAVKEYALTDGKK